MAERSDQPVEAIAGWAGFVAGLHAIRRGSEALDNSTRRSIDLAEETNLSFPAGVRNCNRVPQRRHIDSDQAFPIICHGSSSCDEDRLDSSEQPRTHSVGRAT